MPKKIKWKLSKYKCRECGFQWEGYRKDPGTGRIAKESGGAGMTLCPKCDHNYIDWLNYESYASWYRDKIGDGGCGGTRSK